MQIIFFVDFNETAAYIWCVNKCVPKAKGIFLGKTTKSFQISAMNECPFPC
jgi:hypothetical protein